MTTTELIDLLKKEEELNDGKPKEIDLFLQMRGPEYLTIAMRAPMIVKKSGTSNVDSGLNRLMLGIVPDEYRIDEPGPHYIPMNVGGRRR